MGQLADAVGFANGALARYFPDKEAVLQEAFRRALATVDERARSTIGDQGGIEALRLFCLQVMPLDDVRLREARLLVGFWDHAADRGNLREFFARTVGGWRERVQLHLRQARASGEIDTRSPDRGAAVVEQRDGHRAPGSARVRAR